MDKQLDTEKDYFEECVKDQEKQRKKKLFDWKG
jgi:hypothetical protein